jgi:rhamnosyltransferase subunit B
VLLAALAHWVRVLTKRVVLTTLGSFGDLHPFVAVALALEARGVEAVVATSEAYREKIEAEGLAFRSYAPTPGELLQDTGLSEADVVRKIARSAAAFIVDKVVTPYIERSYADLACAMQGADLVVTSSFSVVARLAAEKLRLPTVSLLLSPSVILSAEEPSEYVEAPWLRPLRQSFGAGAAKLALDLGRQRSRWQTRKLSQFRRRLGLPIPPGDEVLDGPLRADWIAALYSPLLGDLPPEAPENSLIAGFTFYDSETGAPAAAPEGLTSFLDEGPPPLVFTLGSIAVYAAGDFYEVAAAAARELGRRAVLLVGAEAKARLDGLSSPDLIVASYAPHSLVFPRAAAVIHHGGIGTVAQALRAGRPQLVCPMLGDQADNARRLVELGVARRLDHKRFSLERAVEAIGAVLADEALARAAKSHADIVAREDGAAVVADGVVKRLDSSPNLAT